MITITIKMKLASIIFIFCCLFIELFAKSISDGNGNESNSMKEYTYEIKYFDEEIIVDRNSLLTIKIEDIQNFIWMYSNRRNNGDYFELKSEESYNTCSKKIRR